MKQRYTIELQRYPHQEATIEIVADGLPEAQARALEMARSAAFPWVTENEGARVIKVIVHAGEVPDEPNP